MDLVNAGGFMMYPMIAIALAVAGMAVWSWRTLQVRQAGGDAVVETRIDSVLFWGAYGVVLGILGTLVGIAQAASAIEAAGGVSAPMVWGGIKVALITVIFGFLVFSVALVAWFALRVAYRRRVAVA
jgi:hypothetical protein